MYSFHFVGNVKGETTPLEKPVKTDLDRENEEPASDTESDQYRVPYYVENFKLIMKSILEDTYYEELFNERDLDTVAAFNGLSGKFILQCLKNLHQIVRSMLVSK